ncbi:MAG: IclR family transcriptional regulator [Oscillospiraceae bacterium]
MAEGSVQSLERAFGLLEQLAVHSRGAGLMELSNLTGLHKSTTHRLLASLIGLGYVVQDSASGHYRLTYKLLTLSNNLLEGVDVLSVSKSHLDDLSEQTGETVHLMVPDGWQGVYIYKSEPARTTSVQMRSRVGLRVPLVYTAAGKAMLADETPERVAQVWQESGVAAITPRTIVALSEFTAELERVRVRGWAMDDEENELGVRCVGAAIPDYTGKALGAMSISGNVAKMTPQRVAELTPLLLTCRDNICRDLGVAR